MIPNNGVPPNEAIVPQVKPTYNQGKPRRMTSQIEFYKVCNTLAGLAEQFMRDRPRLEDACAILSEKCGFPVPKSALNQAKEATGIHWGMGASQGKRFARPSSVVARHLVHLYTKLGEPIPDDLAEIAGK